MITDQHQGNQVRHGQPSSLTLYEGSATSPNLGLQAGASQAATLHYQDESGKVSFGSGLNTIVGMRDSNEVGVMAS